MRVVILFFVLIFYGIMLLPGIQYFFTPFPKQSIAGLGWIDRKIPKLTVERVSSGSFQKAFENWFKQNNGFWGIFVRMDSDVNVNVFSQSASKYGPLVVLGKNKTLYRDQYIEDYNRGNLVPPSELEQRAKNFKRLQVKLAERNVPVLYLITPTKASLYPEDIPESQLVRSRLSKKRNYDHFVAFLDQNEVDYIDGHRHFAERKEEYPFGVFARTGSHWNDVAICDMSRIVFKEIGEKIGRKVMDFTCRPVKMKPIPVGVDQDLLDLLNLSDETGFYTPTPYPHTKPITDGDEYLPDVLFVGDSFLHGLLRFYDWHKVYRRRDLYFYFKKFSRYPSMEEGPIYRSAVKWEEDVFSKDAIIVEINEAFIDSAGFNFVPDALKALGG